MKGFHLSDEEYGRFLLP